MFSSSKMECLLIVYLMTIWTCSAVFMFKQKTPALYEVRINLEKAISETEDEFLSICLDPYLKHDYPGKPWSTLNFTNPRVHTLAQGLAPAILRFGGTDADWSVFYNVTSPTAQAEVWKTVAQIVEPPAFIVPFFPQDIDNLHNLAKSAGGQLLYDFNIQKRYGNRWDPTNAYTLLQYIQEQGYAQDMAFELGNEPYYPELKTDGKGIGEDLFILKKLLNQLQGFENVKIVGPDIGVSTGGDILKIAADFAATVRKNITAFTLHHYYFAGPEAKLNQFYDVSYFDYYEYVISVWRDAMRRAAGEMVDVWVGETSDSYNYGSPNITNKYLSGLLWLDKLGISARNEYKLVARQDFYGGNYPLISNEMYPNPDYWLSFVYKRLVGRQVLKVDVGLMPVDKGQLVRVYAHCTSPRASYPKGSITVYVVNLLQNSTALLMFDKKIFGENADLYSMLPQNRNLLSSSVELNGRVLALVDDHTLPKLNPMEVSLKASVGIPSLSYGFIVLKNANAKICTM